MLSNSGGSLSRSIFLSSASYILNDFRRSKASLNSWQLLRNMLCIALLWLRYETRFIISVLWLNILWNIARFIVNFFPWLTAAMIITMKSSLWHICVFSRRKFFVKWAKPFNINSLCSSSSIVLFMKVLLGVESCRSRSSFLVIIVTVSWSCFHILRGIFAL